jgi:CDP-diacylglycerol--glycerol-3-phosphate 3-phosphatidyltransferase
MCAMEVTGRRPLVLRQLPNALSAIRILCAPVLLLLAITGYQVAFTWVLVVALLTDVADGWIARGFGLQSRLGARLDTVGDSLIWYAALAGLIAFQRDVLAMHAGLIGAVVCFWILESVLAWLRYRRLSSFHTYLSKAAGVLLSVWIGVLFVLGHQPWLLGVAAALSILANLEEMLLIGLLPQWRSDVKGAWWVLRDRQQTRN